MKSKLIRLAKEEDYIFNNETKLWHLSFDSRPVIGAITENPSDGAFKYNYQRMKFIKALNNTRDNESSILFTDLIEWAVSKGDETQCRIVLNMFNSKNISDYQRAALELIRYRKDNYPNHLEIAVFFTGFNNRLISNLELLQKLKDKS